VHPERFPNDGNIIEEWSKFPEARQLLYDTILNSGVKSPLLVSGDVHMAQILRKDCIRAMHLEDYVDNGGGTTDLPPKRPLVEVTTSGMTHSWGTSFSSQPKNHKLPLKLYTYFVSYIFMSVAHLVCPWNDLEIQTANDIEHRSKQSQPVTRKAGRAGKQFYLGLNFADFEFDFDTPDGGAVTVSIFGIEDDAPSKLQTRWTFDQLSGIVDLPGMTANAQDFLTSRSKFNLPLENDEWICVPHRGLPSLHHEYAANIIMFFTFCTLFFMPHAVIISLLWWIRRWWSRKRKSRNIMK